MRKAAVILLMFLMGTSSSQTADTIQIRLLLDSCGREYSRANYESARSVIQQAITISEETGNEKQLGQSFWNMGLIMEKLGKTDNSFAYYSRALAIAKKLNMKRLEGNCYHSAGWAYYLQGSYDLALNNFFNAVRIREELKDTTGLAWTRNNIGLIYWQQHDRKKALDYFLEAHKLFQNKKSLSGLALATNNIGLIYEETGDYKNAMKYYRESFYQNKEANNLSGVSLTLNNIGGLFFIEGQLDSVEYYMSEALKINREIDHLEGLHLNYQNLAEYHKEKKHYDVALRYADSSISVCMKGKFPDGLINSYRTVAGIYYAKGDYKRAYEAHEKYSLYNDSLNFGDKINDMEAKYLKEKSEKEIALLKSEKEIADLELKRKQWTIYAAVAGGLLLLGVVVFYVRISSQRKRTNDALEQKNTEIIKQKEIIEEKSKDITDSILYAKRIQDAVLPTEESFERIFSGHFIIFKPRDIVSGDFYWLAQIEEKVIVALADCTGHGVPGAFMSIIGHDLLNQVVHEDKITKPSLILSEIDKNLSAMLNKRGKSQTNDGMDMAIIMVDRRSGILTFAGAYRPLLIVDKNGHRLIHGTKNSIGGHKSDIEKAFSDIEIQLSPDQKFYLLSDGFADQFGGPKGKKYKFRKMQEKLTELYDKDLQEQKEIMELDFNVWRGDLGQVDDVCVIGLKI